MFQIAYQNLHTYFNTRALGIKIKQIETALSVGSRIDKTLSRNLNLITEMSEMKKMTIEIK